MAYAPYNDQGPALGPLDRPRVRLNAINEAWAWFNAAAGTWVGASLLVLILNAVLEGVANRLLGTNLPRGGGGFIISVPPAGRFIVSLISAVINGFLLGGMFRLACLQLRGQPIRVARMFELKDVLHELIIGALIVAAITFVAAFFFVIPSFIAAGLLMFTIPLIVDGGLKGTDAVKASFHTLKGQWISATFFHLVVAIVAGLGACLCLVGLLFTMPLYALSVGILYRDFYLRKPQGLTTKPTVDDPYF